MQRVCPSASRAGESQDLGKCYQFASGEGVCFPSDANMGLLSSKDTLFSCLFRNPRNKIGSLGTLLPPCHPFPGLREGLCHGRSLPPLGHKGSPDSSLSSSPLQVKKAILHFIRTLLSVQGLDDWAWDLVAYIFKQSSLSTSQMVREIEAGDLVLLL